MDVKVNKNDAHKSNSVFWISLTISFVVVFCGIFVQKGFAAFANWLLAFLTGNFGWFYLLSVSVFLFYSAYLAFSRYGNIKLGPENSKPEYSNLSWFAMLFGAGMGIGLLFWGVAEPMCHFIDPPGIEPGSAAAENFAIKTSFMHWGVHPWAIFCVIGLALAYFQYRKNKPALISTIFIPLLGEDKANGPIGKTVDILATLTTIAGIATSLGLGTLQINSGLNYLFGIPESRLVQIMIVAVITLIFTWSAVKGIDKGIKVLGDINLWLALILVLLMFMVGPSLKILNSFTNGLGNYLSALVCNSLRINTLGNNDWLNRWTIFYWAWWIAWTPFVSTFIARISKGRTIREFICGVTLAPALASMVWFSVFGNSGLALAETIGVEGMNTVAESPETALFLVMKHYPLGSLLSCIAILLLCTFFITSANSATFVLAMLTSRGDLNPSNKKKVIWGITQSLLATSLLLAGGLQALQTASIAAAFPFIFVIILAMISLMKILRKEVGFTCLETSSTIKSQNTESEAE